MQRGYNTKFFLDREDKKGGQNQYTEEKEFNSRRSGRQQVRVTWINKNIQKEINVSLELFVDRPLVSLEKKKSST